MANCEQQSLDGFTYDVFLSFRGEDTRENIVGYLLEAFEKRGINVFYDDIKLELGEDISTALCKESNISVIVLSQNYASSWWCLDELANIMECTKRNKKQIAFPIFYHVDPSDVRHQRNNYGKAMVAHQDRFGKDSEKIKAWTEALSDVGNLKGHHIDTRFEINHVKEIAEKVHANIAPKPLIDGENPVGLDQRIEEVKSLLDLKPNDDTVCMLGIYGLGGIGKTNLAKALYNKIAHQFKAACFLADVSEKSNKINGLEDLQLTLLSEMFKKPDFRLGSTSRGIKEIKDKLGRKKVLLVLDDVDEMKQLENLAGGSDWFGRGSRIIITTRDQGLFMGTHPIELKTYEMTELNDQHSLELFCRNAFGKSNPIEGYEAVSSRAVGYAKGLPLALKVIGSNLRTRKSLKAWEAALKDYERIPRKGIQDVLKVSYDVLEPSAQSVFLDIACFFKGERIEYVEQILDEFGAASNIEELVNKSLLNVDNGKLNMHDLIQDMGREIVRQESPNPAKRSRLWLQQDVFDVLSANDYGSDTIQGIMLDPRIYMTEVYWNDFAFEKMNCLRILIVRNITFTSKPEHLPNHLRLLDWEGYPSNTFPPKFYPRNIIVLNLPNSQLTWKEPFKQFSYLTVMNLSSNQSIKRMPNVSNVENLTELRLDGCRKLTSVHKSIGFLKHLVHLSASGCTKLRNFLRRMFLPSLEVLNLNGCGKLKQFPDIVNKMNKPLKIHMLHTSIKTLPNSVANLIGLVSLNMQWSSKLEYLPACIKESIHLKSLDVNRCRKLQNIPECTNLRILDVRYCTSLTHIPELPCIKKIHAINCFKISSETAELLYDQVKKERSEFDYIVMPLVKFIPEWFDYICEGGIPVFWVRGKFPRVALALVFEVDEGRELYAARSFTDFVLFINGKRFAYVEKNENGESVRRVRRSKRYGNEADHVLVCDIRGFYDDEEWLNIDAFLLKHEWNEVAICYEVNESTYDPEMRNTLTLSEWGVYVYKQGNVNWEEHFQFTCPTEDPITTLEEFKYEYSNDDDKTIGIADVPNPTTPEVDEIDQDTPMFEENEEHVTHEDTNDAAVNENENHDDKTIGIEDIPRSTDLEFDRTQGTPYPSGFFRRLLYACFCKCFS